jgi:O-antigen ligase
MLGGGGSPAPRPELALQLVAASACCLWVFLPRDAGVPRSRGVIALALLAVVLPLAQLIPLPPAVWQSLPGREIERAVLALVGAESAWMPWSISPSLTLAALLAVLPAIAAMVMVSRLDLAGRRTVIACVAIMGLASVAVGTLQLSAAPGSWAEFYPGSIGRVFGFQANRNAEVDVLLIALVAGAAVYAGSRRRTIAPTMLFAAFALLMALGAILTASRAGIALLPVAALFAAAVAMRGPVPPRRLAIAGGAALLAVVLLALMVRENAALGRVAERFAVSGDFRTELWTDTIYAIGQYWPFGSGLGTFVPAIIAAERLEVVDETLPNRAHNDFLELALEGGIFGIALLAVMTAIICCMAWRAWRGRNGTDRPLILFAVATLVVITFHSFVDYPLRSMALAHLAGVAAGLFAPLSRSDGSGGSKRELQS